MPDRLTVDKYDNPRYDFVIPTAMLMGAEIRATEGDERPIMWTNGMNPGRWLSQRRAAIAYCLDNGIALTPEGK